MDYVMSAVVECIFSNTVKPKHKYTYFSEKTKRKSMTLVFTCTRYYGIREPPNEKAYEYLEK